jgi:mevalonate kinase
VGIIGSLTDMYGGTVISVTTQERAKCVLRAAAVEPLAAYVPALPLIAAHAGVKHRSGDVHKSPRVQWLEGDRAVVGGYEQIVRLARLGKRALLERDWRRLGALMNENHRIVAELGGSGPANERLIEAGRWRMNACVPSRRSSPPQALWPTIEAITGRRGDTTAEPFVPGRR